MTQPGKENHFLIIERQTPDSWSFLVLTLASLVIIFVCTSMVVSGGAHQNISSNKAWGQCGVTSYPSPAVPASRMDAGLSHGHSTSDPISCLWPGKSIRRWSACLRPCHPHEKPGESSWLGSAQLWLLWPSEERTSGCKVSLSLPLFLCKSDLQIKNE